MIKTLIIVLLLTTMSLGCEKGDLVAYTNRKNPSPHYFEGKCDCHEWHEEPFNNQIDFTMKVHYHTPAQAILNVVLKHSSPHGLDFTKFIMIPLHSTIGAYSCKMKPLVRSKIHMVPHMYVLYMSLGAIKDAF